MSSNFLASGLSDRSTSVRTIVGIRHCPISIGNTFKGERPAAKCNTECGIRVMKRPVASNV